MYKIKKYRHIIQSKIEDQEDAPSSADKYAIQKCQRRYGFLYVGIKQEYYFWEFANINRKIIILFTCNFLASVSADVQCLVTIIIVIANLMAIIRLQPFASKMSNKINIIS